MITKQTANTRFVDRAKAYGCFGEQVLQGDGLIRAQTVRYTLLEK